MAINKCFKCLSIVSDASFLPKMSKGMALAVDPPPLPPGLFKKSPLSAYAPLSYPSLLQLVFLSSRNFNFTHINFLHKLFTLLSLKMNKPSQSSYFSTHSTTIHFTAFTKISCNIFSYMLSPSHLVISLVLSYN